MGIRDAIVRRHSVRTYDNSVLTGELAKKIEEKIASLTTPFGPVPHMELIHVRSGGRAERLGTYGFISGANEYLTLVCGAGEWDEIGAAYAFEQLVLYCTGLGLGTCWLGGSFRSSDFSRRLTIPEGQRLRIVSPVGVAAGRRRMIEKLIFRNDGDTRTRKPFGSLFFEGGFGRPLTPERAGIYAEPLEMVRIAPSANNKQPWRVVMDGARLHFYKTPSHGFENIDLGIALCHFGETCRESGLTGRFGQMQDAPSGDGAPYVTSWIGG